MILSYHGALNNSPLLHALSNISLKRRWTGQPTQLQDSSEHDNNRCLALLHVMLSLYTKEAAVWCVLQVGWFLHTPFPSSEIYRTLPVREDVLRATLRADLIGFHTYDYARHFISSCTRILGLEGTPEGVEDNGRYVLCRFSAGKQGQVNRSC